MDSCQANLELVLRAWFAGIDPYRMYAGKTENFYTYTDQLTEVDPTLHIRKLEADKNIIGIECNTPGRAHELWQLCSDKGMLPDKEGGTEDSTIVFLGITTPEYFIYNRPPEQLYEILIEE